ncbi:MAG: glycosyltransferase [Chthoniobacterales bacterium]
MKVTFYLADQNPQRDRSLGITAYSDGLIRSLAGKRALELAAVTSPGSYRPPAGVEVHRLPFSTSGGVGRFLSDNLHPLLCQVETDIWHYPKGYLPTVCRYRKPAVGTVHDLILQHYADHYPEDRSPLAYTYWKEVLRRSIPRFDLILTVSRTSEWAIRAFCDRYRLRCPPIRVTYEGFQIGKPPLAVTRKEDFVIHLASRELHKRTRTLLEFWEQLATVGNHLPRLKLIGSLRVSDRKLATSLPGVEVCGRLPRSELDVEISQARALIFPSEVEGFGLPAAEAYALRTPVVYVSGTAVEEVLGEKAPGGFLLSEVETFRLALQAVLALSPAAIEERAAEITRRFAWANCAAATIAAYQEL